MYVDRPNVAYCFDQKERTVSCECGAVFTTRIRNKKYCSDPCSMRAKKEKWRAAWERKKAKQS